MLKLLDIKGTKSKLRLKEQTLCRLYSLQSIAQNTLEFLEKEEHANIYK